MTAPKAKQTRGGELPPTTDEIEVLRRMLHTPPTPHKPKGAPSVKKIKLREKK